VNASFPVHSKLFFSFSIRHDALGGAMIPYLPWSPYIFEKPSSKGWYTAKTADNARYSAWAGSVLYTIGEYYNKKSNVRSPTAMNRWVGKFDHLTTSYTNANCSSINHEPLSAFPPDVNPNSVMSLNMTTVNEGPAFNLWFENRSQNESLRITCLLQKHSVDIVRLFLPFTLII
jgi:hypothetical protein